jgi:hypothetical protein
MTDTKKTDAPAEAPKAERFKTYQDSRTGALRKSKRELGFPYVGPLTAADVEKAEEAATKKAAANAAAIERALGPEAKGS